MKPADHPPGCTECNGTGWQTGPPIHGHANGRDFTYSTVEPCTHHWTGDNPTPTLLSADEHRKLFADD